MKNKKKLVTILMAVLLVGAATVTAFAATFRTPAEILSGLTGKPVESIIDEKTEGNKTYGAVAAENGVLEAYKAQILEEKKAYLEERVEEGTMTRERADAIGEALQERIENCDGTGYADGGCGLGAGFGGNGGGCALGAGNGSGYGRGNGNGSGRGGCGMGLGASRG